MQKTNEIESLDFIDNYILSSFDFTNSIANNNTDNSNIIKTKMIPISTPSSPTLQLGSYSASIMPKSLTVINNENETSILSLNSSIRRDSLIEQKSSTPKISSTLTKEFAILSDLYEKGILNDGTQFNPTNSCSTKNTKPEFQQNDLLENQMLSPIIGDCIKPKLKRLANNQYNSNNDLLLRKTLKKNLIKSQLLDFESINSNKNGDEIKSIKHSISFDNSETSSLMNYSLKECGFATASGKKLSFDVNSLDKVKELHDDESNNKNGFKSNIDQPSNIVEDKKLSFLHVPNKKSTTESNDQIIKFDFTTAKGKQISMSADALENAKKLIEADISIDTVNDKRELSIVSSGFTTAKGKQISMSANALENAKKLIEADIDTVNDKRELSIFSSGFTTAKGKQISMSANALENAKKLIEADIDTVNDKRELSIVSSGFTTAKGKQISMSANALENAKNKIQIDNEEIISAKNNLTEPTIISSGFSTAKGKMLQVNSNLLAKEMQKHEKLNLDTEFPTMQTLTNTNEEKKNEKKKLDNENKEDTNPVKCSSVLTKRTETNNRNYKSYKKPKFISKAELTEKIDENKLKVNEFPRKQQCNDFDANKTHEDKSYINDNNSNTNSFLCCYGLKMNTQERTEIEQSINTLLLNESLNSTNQALNKTNLNLVTDNDNSKSDISDLCSFNIYNNANNTNYLDLVKTMEISVDNKKAPSFKQYIIKPIFKVEKMNTIALKSFEHAKLDGKNMHKSDCY